MDHTPDRERLPALRDFFGATNAAQLSRGADALARAFGLPLDESTDWTAVEYDFNRLFVGPASLAAPPYASAYQREPTLMGSPALAVREAYRSLGLAVPDQGATPDDHLAFELDAMAALEGAEGQFDEVRSWMVHEHLGDWVPRFVDAVRTAPNVSAPIRMAVNALEAWLHSACTRTPPPQQ